MKIEIKTLVNAPIAAVWRAWVTPEDIENWNYATDDWCCPKAEVNLQVGRGFNYRMEAKDGSMGFDFAGVYTKVEKNKAIHFELDDQRLVTVAFVETSEGVEVIETFDAEDENSAAQQRDGWLCILNNFKRYIESKAR